MPKLYELLAVREQAKGQADAARKDLLNTFEKKRGHFEEKRTEFVPSHEGGRATVEAQSDIQTNIPHELDWIGGIWSKALDISFQIDAGNVNAKADVVLDDGTPLLTGVPTTALLELEKRAVEIQELIAKIPTLDPMRGFAPDPHRANIFVARPVAKTRTKKTFVPLVLAAATKEHPAQVKEGWEDQPIGTITEQEWSGLITPKIKGELLERAEEFRRAVKAARQRANDLELPKPQAVGAKVFGFIFGNVSEKAK